MFRSRILPILLLFILTVAVGACGDTAAPVPTAPTAVATSGPANLSPSSTGSGQMVERPLTMTGTSVATFIPSATCMPDIAGFPMGCAFEGNGEGVASHFGKIIIRQSGTFPNGVGTIVAANGDKVDFESNEMTGSAIFTGGTGRFKGATGGVTGSSQPLGLPTMEGGLFVLRVAWSFEGTIKY